MKKTIATIALKDLKTEIKLLNQENDPIKKIMQLKFDRKFRNVNFDPDVSMLSMKSAEKVYPFLKGSKLEKQPNSQGLKFQLELHDIKIYRGDIMNSYYTVFKAAIKNLIDKETYWRLCNENGIEYLNDGLLSHLDIFLKQLPKPVVKGLYAFAVNNHTLANVCPIPSGTNAPRYKLTADYWGINLLAIKNHFEGNDSYLREIYQEHSNDMIAHFCRFKSWMDFVTQTYQEPYINNENHEVLEGFEGQFDRFRSLLQIDVSKKKNGFIADYLSPKTEDEFIEWLDFTNNAIIERAKLLEKAYKQEGKEKKLE